MNVRSYFVDQAAKYLVKVADVYGFPLTKPTSQDTLDKMFKGKYTSANYTKWYKRYQSARRIVDIFPAYGLKEGFQINLTDNMDTTKKKVQEQFSDNDELANELVKVWDDWRPVVEHAGDLARLYGSSILFIGWNDVKNPADLSKPVKVQSTVKYLYAFRDENEFTVNYGTDFPPAPSSGMASVIDGASNIHPSRFIHWINRDITDEADVGLSELELIGDILVVQKHADFSIGQRLWRAAVGLLFLMAPKGTKSAERTETEDRFAELNSTTVATLPYGWDGKVFGLGSRAGGIEGTYDRVVEQYSVATGIPYSILSGKQTAYATKTTDREEFQELISTYQVSELNKIWYELIRRVQKYGTWPKGNFKIYWNEIFKKSPVDKAKEQFTLNVLEVANKEISNKPWDEIQPIIQNAWRLLK